MKCRACQAALTALSLDDLDDARAEEVRGHLSRCPACRAEAARLDALLDALRAAFEAEPAPRLDAERRRALLAVAPAPADPAQRIPDRRRFRISPRALGLAAMLLVMLGLTVGIFLPAMSLHRGPSPVRKLVKVRLREAESLDFIEDNPRKPLPGGGAPLSRAQTPVFRRNAGREADGSGAAGGEVPGRTEDDTWEVLEDSEWVRERKVAGGKAHGDFLERSREKASRTRGEPDVTRGGATAPAPDRADRPAASIASGDRPKPPAQPAPSAEKESAEFEQADRSGRAKFEAPSEGSSPILFRGLYASRQSGSRSESLRRVAPIGTEAPEGGAAGEELPEPGPRPEDRREEVPVGGALRRETLGRLVASLEGDEAEAAVRGQAAPESRLEKTAGSGPGLDAAPPADRAPPDLPAVNPVVDTAEEARSTFGVDVDTASYMRARAALLEGRLPEPESVRTEEFVNAFDYADPPPEAAAFGLHIEAGPAPFRPDRTLLRIGVKGRRLGREEQRPAVLTIALDVSGSMARPDRIGLARTAVHRLLENLAPEDRVGLVTFNHEARLALEATPANESAKIRAVLDALRCTGSTHLENGLDLAYRQAANAFVPGAENRVLLLTDGVTNLGSGDAGAILKRIEHLRRQGITCSVFGLGAGTYNDELLKRLADKGHGVYRFLDGAEAVERAFVDDLAATLHTIALDARVQVEFDPGTVRSWRQLGYERRRMRHEDFRDETVAAGEVGSGQAVTALYELDLAEIPPRGPLGEARVRYRRVRDGAWREIAAPIPASAVAGTLDGTRPEFRLAAGAAQLAEILRRSPHARGGDPGRVADLLRPVALERPLDRRIAELVFLCERAAELMR